MRICNPRVVWFKLLLDFSSNALPTGFKFVLRLLRLLNCAECEGDVTCRQLAAKALFDNRSDSFMKGVVR